MVALVGYDLATLRRRKELAAERECRPTSLNEVMRTSTNGAGAEQPKSDPLSEDGTC